MNIGIDLILPLIFPPTERMTLGPQYGAMFSKALR